MNTAGLCAITNACSECSWHVDSPMSPTLGRLFR